MHPHLIGAFRIRESGNMSVTKSVKRWCWVAVAAAAAEIEAAADKLRLAGIQRPRQGLGHHHHARVLRVHLRIDVEDHCGGLPQGAVEDVFQPFKQSGEDRSGLGLGLAICRRSVEANNGVLSVRDAPGSGCVFTIELPRHVLA